MSIAYREPVAHIGFDGNVVALAFPFDQGRFEEKDGRAKPQGLLFTDTDAWGDPNLPVEAWHGLMRWLLRQRLVMHHAKHDVITVRAGTRMGWPGYDLLPAVDWDTQLAEWILTPNSRVGLDASADRMGEEKQKDIIRNAIQRGKGRYGTLSSPRYDLIPWPEIEPYAKSDASITLKLREQQARRFQEEQALADDLYGHFQHEMDVMRTLVGMTQRGIGYRYQASIEAAQQATTLADQVAKTLPFTPTPDRAAHWFYKTKDAMPHCTTEKLGRPSVRECCIRQLRQSPDGEVASAAESYAQWTKVDHAVSKYYLGWADAMGDDGRLRTDFRQTGTVNFRFSSKRVNLQAIPNDYRMELVEGVITPRALFVSAPGHELWEFDLEQAELRGATSYAGCKRMRELIESEEYDAHTETARALFGKVDKEYRNIAKRCNFALLYSVGAKTFDTDVERTTGIKLGETRAKQIISDWRNLYPEFPRVNQRAEVKARGRGWVRLWDGRKRWFSSMEMQFELHKAFNAVIQGGVAQLIKRIMVEVDQQVPDSLVLQIHDSIVVELAKPVVDSGDGQPQEVALIEKVGSELGTKAFDIQMEFAGKRW